MTLKHKQFRPGDHVRTPYGNTTKVLAQHDCRVIVRGGGEMPGNWYHPNNLTLISQTVT